ncbi:hypothetical protein BP6252_04273 [Coleophoma cylindrospora]|uniref:DNA mismatch repair protein PMS1 n=1 Tax=Coleophoma cylindrospora TaxID=1849047 RepID=A0A3D8S016_9HELO|nr:hypothetical protein BP6252_04273 [Coleophoma cylindrospora]
MATIKPIERRTIHQIQSGQVIVDLCSVVKELVENSLDAGATHIEPDVRFRNQGLESIEVQDNGDGISPNNYETLALKHHTSKLSDYSDLTTLQTFGFRGEALSSLCALSHFSVTTCMAADAPKGTKLEFETSGKLKGTSVVAAQKGTLVSVENLFRNLPVRRRELERKIKTEWNRVIGVLGQYACIQTGIKFSVSQQTNAKGKKATLFSTKGNPSTKENIVNVFGAKTLTALVPLDLKLDLELTSGQGERWSTQDDGGKKEIRIVGHISRPAFGEGRQTPDRQMFFVNARPCGLPQVAKAFNEVYKIYNVSQSPFIFANIELDTHLYDVNVSPDKRTILLHDQTRMLENLKTELTALFDSQDYTVPVSQIPIQRQPLYKQLTISRENSGLSRTGALHTPETQVRQSEVNKSENGSSPDYHREDEEPQRKDDLDYRQSALPRESTDRDRDAVNLISNWTTKIAECKPDIDPAESVSGEDLESFEGLSKDKLVKGPEDLKLASTGTDDQDGTFTSPDRSTITSSYQPPIQVVDFNRHMEELGRRHQTRCMDEKKAAADSTPRPALATAIPAASATSSIFSNIKGSKRPSDAMATITIGDHTITSSIGKPHPKRQKSDEENSSTRSRRHVDPTLNELPSFGKNLSQRFGALGATQQYTSSEDDQDDCGGSDIQDEESSSRPESPPLFVDQAPPEADNHDTVSDADMVAENIHESSLNPPDGGNVSDGEYIDEEKKKAHEEAKVRKMIQAVEEEATRPSQENELRAKTLLKGSARKKDSTVHLVKTLETSIAEIQKQFQTMSETLEAYQAECVDSGVDAALDSAAAEEQLSLTISKADFAKMKIVGQFNLGFILATRVSESKSQSVNETTSADDLFIIDQHASDEKYNFERLQATTIVQSQRLVRPKTLDLTAVEEEIVMENLKALESNGFVVSIDESGETPVGQRCQLVSLPLSRETTFSLTDLNELIALLSEHPAGFVPRPSKVRKMFAMRACRSSIMIGKTLNPKQMGKVVRHMGEIDKPWNCPHGRPTMRHLCGLNTWDELGWKERNGIATDWAAYTCVDGGDDDTLTSPKRTDT